MAIGDPNVRQQKEARRPGGGWRQRSERPAPAIAGCRASHGTLRRRGWLRQSHHQADQRFASALTMFRSPACAAVNQTQRTAASIISLNQRAGGVGKYGLVGPEVRFYFIIFKTIKSDRTPTVERSDKST